VLFLSAGTLGVCALPTAPGCRPGESLPQGEELLGVALVAEGLTSSIQIDRDGRSMFHPDFTVWMLSTPGACRTLPEDDVAALDAAWRAVGHAPRTRQAREPEKPFLLVIYLGAGEERKFFVRPEDGFLGPERPTIRTATALTLKTLHRTYGDRFLRELHAAGLESLLKEPP
jgi:hypothetical protein